MTEAERAAIERELVELKRQIEGLGDLERRIRALEARLAATSPPPASEPAAPAATATAAAPPQPAAAPAPAQAAIVAPMETPPVLEARLDRPVEPELVTATSYRPEGKGYFGTYDINKGFGLVRTPHGEVNFGFIGYVRYLNQNGLDETYTDYFGNTTELDLRNDIQVNKATINFRGWLFDERLRYLVFVWTQNAGMGEGAQVVVGGNMSWTFDPKLILTAGVEPLPSTRSTNYTFPVWLRVDHRTIADEFFRGSYTTGISLRGELTKGLQYRVMLGNNLAQLGVSAAELDGGFNTLSAALWWMPTTGEYGFAQGIGDFDNHQEVATLFGVHFTRSREDAQGQPGVDDFENTQIRLSDGTLVMKPGSLTPGVQVQDLRYRMLAANAGAKYRGWSIEGEYYVRWLDQLNATGPIPFDSFFDHGFKLEGSTMLIQKKLQAYASGSYIVGEFGMPADVAVGLNWYPFGRREFRINTQALHLSRSPVGYASVPFALGGTGWVFTTDFALAF